jgi:hypothetical protein
MLGRLFLIFDVIPIVNEFHGYPQLVKEIQHRANGLPVFVLNSYQLTSKYHFYTQERAYGMSSGGRHNQYNIWQDEEQFFGKQVYVVSRRPQSDFEEIDVQGPYKAYGKVLNDFVIYKNVRIERKSNTSVASVNFSDSLVVQNPYHTRIELGIQTRLLMVLVNEKKEWTSIEAESDVNVLEPNRKLVLHIKGKTPIPAGAYSVRFGLQRDQQFYSINSSTYFMIFE